MVVPWFFLQTSFSYVFLVIPISSLLTRQRMDIFDHVLPLFSLLLLLLCEKIFRNRLTRAKIKAFKNTFGNISFPKLIYTIINHELICCSYLCLSSTTVIKSVLRVKLNILYPRWLSGKESTCQCRKHRRCRFDPWVRKNPLEEGEQLTPVFLPRKILWTKKPCELWSMGSQRVGHNWARKTEGSGQEKKGMKEDRVVGWLHWVNGHEFEQALGDGEGQASMECSSP